MYAGLRGGRGGVLPEPGPCAPECVFARWRNGLVEPGVTVWVFGSACSEGFGGEVFMLGFEEEGGTGGGTEVGMEEAGADESEARRRLNGIESLDVLGAGSSTNGFEFERA